MVIHRERFAIVVTIELMAGREKQGFTLIEILVVVAIISILATVVLVGLGPTQQTARDARRLSDLREAQNALELFYYKCGFYPGTASGGVCAPGSPGTDWNGFTSALGNANIGVSASSIPSDPSTNRTYGYAYNGGNTTYVLGAALENANNSVLNGYNAPVTTGYNWVPNGGSAIAPNASCSGQPTNNGSGATYCISL